MTAFFMKCNARLEWVNQISKSSDFVVAENISVLGDFSEKAFSGRVA